MNLIFFTHPEFLGIRSISNYTLTLSAGMKNRGHNVEVWAPKKKLSKLSVHRSVNKWLGYADQYVFFPFQILRRLKKVPENTLFVFTDNAQGPWVPLVCNRRHVIHCHDFLAQSAALGEIPENPLSWTGRQYQKFIRVGYSKAKNFISVSEKTRQELHRFLSTKPKCSELVYNSIDQSFRPFDKSWAREQLTQQTGLDVSNGYILHTGGNQWYKNRIGVVELYTAWRVQNNQTIPLVLIGQLPDHRLKQVINSCRFRDDIHCFDKINNETLSYAYSGASLFLYPSLEEGFGWPIAEAMAAGCPVVTTNKAPMSEVGGEAAFYIQRRPFDEGSVLSWADQSASIISHVIALSTNERNTLAEKGRNNIQKFEIESFLTQIESIYLTLTQQTERVTSGV